MSLPQNIVKELEEAFFLFDYDKDGKIEIREISPVVRSVGLNPTEAELKEIMNDVSGMGGKVDASTLCQLIVKRVRELKTSADQLKDALQVFDKQGTGLIPVQDLKLSLMSLGEKLTEEQLDELIREVDQDGEGMINSDDVVRVLLC